MSDRRSQSDDPGLRSRIIVRDIEIDDLAPVYSLGKRLFTKDDLPVLYRTWEPYEVTYYFNSDPEFCLVAEANGELAGFALGTTVEKDGGSWRYGYLAWLGVSPEYQRQDVATRLLKEFERRMREEGIRMLIVDTEADNAPALRFFDRQGFARPTSHVWLTKSLTKRGNGGIKPMKPARTASASKRRQPVKPTASKPSVA